MRRPITLQRIMHCFGCILLKEWLIKHYTIEWFIAWHSKNDSNILLRVLKQKKQVFVAILYDLQDLGAIFLITDLDFLTICIPRPYAICCYFLAALFTVADDYIMLGNTNISFTVNDLATEPCYILQISFHLLLYIYSVSC